MAVKARKRKKLKSLEMVSKGVRIRCRSCDLRNNCKTRKSKEKSEEMGINTYCSLTPNVPRRKRRLISKIKK